MTVTYFFIKTTQLYCALRFRADTLLPENTVWIRYSNNEIVSWYCLCRAGARVVGVCSHVAAMLWYLGGARFSRKKSYGVRDPGKTVEDAAVLPELIDESESDTDCVEHCIEE